MNDELKKKLIATLKKPGYADHSFSFTRRDFVRFGLIAGGGALLPLTGIETALAAAGIKNQMIPFLTIDLAGGAALPGNFLVGKQDGPEDLFEDYRRLAWNPRESGALDKTFGIPMSKKCSRILAGMKQTLPTEISENENQTMFKMASFCHFSLDDNRDNPSSILTMVAKAGLRGSLVRAGLGSKNGNSGGHSSSFLKSPPFQPKLVTDESSILSMTSFGDTYEKMDASLRQRLFQNLKIASGGSKSLQDIYHELSQTGLTNPALDFRNSADIAKIFSGGPVSANNSLHAGIVYNVLCGHTGPGAITIEGCDYHVPPFENADLKDFEIGELIGRAVHAAFVLKKPLFIHIITDGGVSANASDNYERKWTADSNQRSMSVLGYFDPSTPVAFNKHQVGYYTNDGVVDLVTNPLGLGVEKMALGVLANYLYLHGRLDELEKISGARLQPNEIKEFLVFGKT